MFRAVTEYCMSGPESGSQLSSWNPLGLPENLNLFLQAKPSIPVPPETISPAPGLLHFHIVTVLLDHGHDKHSHAQWRNADSDQSTILETIWLITLKYVACFTHQEWRFCTYMFCFSVLCRRDFHPSASIHLLSFTFMNLPF